ncbi:MAG: 3-deoxy-8-phosphooctulonate synthase [Gemmatimonadales bacterium]
MSSWTFGAGPFILAGPCVIEGGDVLPRVAAELARLRELLHLPICFKASFDKANRSRADGARGPGLDEGLRVLERVRRESGLPVLTDIHEPGQAAPAAAVVDVLQIPAFLCRQTDLLVAAGQTGRPVNVKKGQWMSAAGMAGAVEKVRQGGATEVAVTERGTFFGYGDLVVDFRNFARLREATAAPVIFDATHSVQQPGQGEGGTSGGLREFIPDLLAAAAVAGADGFFLETHPDPARAPSDAATQWPLDRLEWLLTRTLELQARSRESRGA